MPHRAPLQDFKDFLVSLNKEKVKFLIVGAHAMSQHGYTRATGDLDILVFPELNNYEALIKALKRFGAPCGNLSVEDFQDKETVFQIGVPPLRIDILNSVDGVSAKAAFAKSTKGRMLGVSVRFLGLDSLIANKTSTGRPKDLLDVAELKALRKRRAK